MKKKNKEFSSKINLSMSNEIWNLFEAIIVIHSPMNEYKDKNCRLSQVYRMIRLVDAFLSESTFRVW